MTDGPTDQRMDQRMERQTDGPTDKASYRVACPQLKKERLVTETGGKKLLECIDHQVDDLIDN